MFKMEFVFNEDKARALGCTAEACYEAVDKLFARYGIYPTSQGVYEAPDNQNGFTAFGVAHRLPYRTDWFLKVIDSWFFSEDDNPEDKSNCLDKYYKLQV